MSRGSSTNGSDAVAAHRAHLHRRVVLSEELEQRVHTREGSPPRTSMRGDALQPRLVSSCSAPPEFRRGYHCPVLGMDFHGSAGGSALPFCSSSTEMLSGERTKAMRRRAAGD